MSYSPVKLKTSDEEILKGHEIVIDMKHSEENVYEDDLNYTNGINHESSIEMIEHAHETNVDSEVISENSSFDYDPLELASIIALTDIGSYMMKKIGRTGDSPELDQLPYFASMRRRWYFFLWEGEPNEWKLVSTKERIDDPYHHDYRTEESPIYLKDVSDIYLEPPPHHGLRIYRNSEVVQLSPLSYSLSESRAWADAFRAAFTLQDAPYQLTHNIRQKYYELLSHQPTPGPSGYRHSGDLEVYQEDVEAILGDEESPNNSPRSQLSTRELLDLSQAPSTSVSIPATPTPIPGVAGCFGRWFGKKSE